MAFSASWRTAERRGWQIFGLAFLFRLQSYVLSGFQNAVSLLKVDILNIMGPAMASMDADAHARRGDVPSYDFDWATITEVGNPAYGGGPKGWVAAWLEAEVSPDWDEIDEIITESYRLIAPKRLVKQLDEG